MTRSWPPRPTKEGEHLTVQAFGITCLLATGYLASGIRVSEPLSLLPPLLIYACLQAIFRLGIRRAQRPIRRRAFLFIV